MILLWKWTKILLVIVLTFSLIGCGTTETEKESSSKKEESEQIKREDNAEQSKKSKVEETKEDPTAKAADAVSENNKNEQPAGNNTQELKQPAASVEKKAAAISPAEPTAPNQTNIAETTTTNHSSSAVNNSAIASAPPPPAEPKPEPAKPTVTISILGPKDRGTIIGQTQETIGEGTTVLDVLLQVTKKKEINVNYSGSGSRAYIIGIDNIEASGSNGWIYKVNGIMEMKGAGAVKVKAGDQISWSYTDN